MGWKTRKLVPNHKCEQPTRLAFIDCETLPCEVAGRPGVSEHRYRLSVVRYCRRDRGKWRTVEDKRFTCRQAQWDYVESLCTPRNVLMVYAHNAVFDLTVSDAWSRIDGGEWVLDCFIDYHTGKRADIPEGRKPWQGLCVIDDRKLILSVCTRGGRMDVIDSLNYYRCSLAELGEAIGLPKKTMPAFGECDETWFDYCQHDVRILSRSITELMGRWHGNNLGNWQPTAASLAWSNYRHAHLDRSITTHDCPVARRLENDAHIGGECRVFFVGDVLSDYDYKVWDWTGKLGHGRSVLAGPVYHYDVRSLYPYVMSNYPMPVELVHTQRSTTADDLEDACAEYFVVADVMLDTNESRYPWRRKDNSRPYWSVKTIYPVGKFVTTLCGEELADAVRSGRVRAAGDMACYRQSRCFVSYVDYWYSRKLAADESGDRVERELCKIMLNSLYGRFAMGRKRYVLDNSFECVDKWGTWQHYDFDTKVRYKCRGVGGNVLVEKDVEPGEHQLAAVAAAVTSYGRSYMRAIRDQLGNAGILYQDTDSLILTVEANDRLHSIGLTGGEGAGSLKLVGQYESLSIWGPKNYTRDGRNVIAGLPGGAVPVGVRAFKGEVFERCESLLSRPCPDGVKVTPVEMDFSRQWNSDIAGRDGWTYPMTVDEGADWFNRRPEAASRPTFVARS